MEAFIEDQMVQMESEAVPMNPHMEGDPWADTAYHYRVKFKKGPKSLVTYFSMGRAHADPPTPEEVLSSLADDAAGYENNPDVDSWVREYGEQAGEEIDPESSAARKEKKLFRTIEKAAEKLKKFLGEDAYKQLLWETERE